MMKRIILAGLVALVILSSVVQVQAQSPPVPGVGWQSGSGEIRYGFAQAPSCTTPRRLAPQFDPFAADGDPNATRPVNLSNPVARRLYGLRYGATVAELDAGIECWRGGMNGAPHGIGADIRLIEAWASGKLGGAAYTGVPNERELQDVTNSGGEWCRLLDMVGQSCESQGTPADGYHRGPLLTLPFNRRGPPHTRKIGYQAAGPADACAWIGRQSTPIMNLVRPPQARCCEGMPASCCTPAGLVPECWQIEPPPPPPIDPPPPVPPTLTIIRCTTSGTWEVSINGVTSIVAAPSTVTVNDLTVALPACPCQCQ